MGFWLIIGLIVVVNVLWWAWAARAVVKHLRRPTRYWALGAVCGFMALMVGGFGWLFLWRFGKVPELPQSLLTLIYVWHIAVLPLGVVVALVERAVAIVSWVRGRGRAKPAAGAEPRHVSADERVAEAQARGEGLALSRRQVLISAAVLAPPVLSGAGTLRGLTQIDEFRTRAFEIPVKGLAAALDGTVIVHVSDVHVGKFAGPALLRKIADRVNAINPDLVLMTGDLIDFDLQDLPAGLGMMEAMNAKYGVFMCEGNHDLFQGRANFERLVRKSGVPALINENVTVNVRGRDVRLLGLRWGEGEQRSRGAMIEANMRETLADAPTTGADLTVLLAHHPHAFDEARAMGIPLTLSGHTHGGQLMLGENLGPGAAMYKYVSGLYTVGDAHAVVSNGTGNWYPLRINAPAEIMKLTLVRA